MAKPAAQHLLIWWPHSKLVDADLARSPVLNPEANPVGLQESHANAQTVDEVRYEVHGSEGQCLYSGQAPLGVLHRCPWLGPLAGPERAPPVLVLLHPADVLLLEVELPSTQGRKLEEALPYVVEPYVLNAPEDNHVSHWPMAHNNPRPMAAVVDKRWVARVVAQCGAAQLQCQVVSCELLRSPLGREPVVWLHNDHVLWVDGLAAPLCLPAQAGALTQHLLAQRCVQVQRVHALGVTSKTAKLGKTLKALLPEHVALEPGRTSGVGLQAATALLEPCLALLNKSLVPRQAALTLGLEAHKGQGLVSHLRPLRWFAVAVVLCWVVGLQVAAWHTQQRQRQLENQIATRFQEVLPNTPMVADPVLLIERELRKHQTSPGLGHTPAAGQGLVMALQILADTLPQAPLHAVRRMAMVEQNIELTFAVPISGDAQARVAQALQNQGYEALWLPTQTKMATNLGSNPENGLLRIRAKGA